MVDRYERARRWTGTARTATAGALLGAVGGAVTGALALLGDELISTGGALAIGIVYGIPFGALFGAAFGVFSGAAGGCLAMHVVRRHALLARVLLAVSSGAFIAAAAAWRLPGPIQVLGTVLAGSIATAAAWASAPWCFRPLLSAGSAPT